MNGSVTSLLFGPGPATAAAQPGRGTAPAARPEPEFRRHLSAALAAPVSRPAVRRPDPPPDRPDDLRRADRADEPPRSAQLPDPPAAERAGSRSQGRPAGLTGRAGAPDQSAPADPAGETPGSGSAGGPDDGSAAVPASADAQQPAESGSLTADPTVDPEGAAASQAAPVAPVALSLAAAASAPANGAAASGAHSAAEAARAAGMPVAPAVLAAVHPAGSPRAGGLPAEAAAFGARTLQQLAADGAPDPANPPADGAAPEPQPPVTLPVEPALPARIPGAPAQAVGGQPPGPEASGGQTGIPGGQTSTPGDQTGAVAAGTTDPAARPTLADLIQLVHQGAARLDEPAQVPGSDGPPAHLPAAAATASVPPAPAADAPPPARPAVQVDPRLVAEQVATAARRVSLAVSGDRSELRVRLWPRELGELHLKLVMEQGALRADIVVARPEVKAALESGLADLRQRLEQQGLQVESFQVAVGGGDAGRQSRQGSGPEFQGRWQRRVPIRPLDLDDDAPPGPVADLALGSIGPRGRHLNGWA